MIGVRPARRAMPGGFLRWIGTIVALLAMGCAGAPPAGAPTPAGDLVIRFLDVGQGDATLITLGDRAVLVDGGRGRDIRLVLDDYGVDSFEAVIASHNHDDHVGGLVAVVADFPVKTFIGNGRAPANANARDLDFWLRRRQVRRPPAPWAPIRLGDARITFIPPPAATARGSENDNSIGVLVERGPFRALLTGDSEVAEIGAWVAAGVIPRVDVLKAPHHGARNGVTPGLIDRARPRAVVISVGAGNGYGHPEEAALRYYRLRGTAVYRTDRDGTVTIRVDRDGRSTISTVKAGRGA